MAKGRRPSAVPGRISVGPENWSGVLEIRSGIDGGVVNARVPRFQPFDKQHLKAVEAQLVEPDLLLLRCRTRNSRIGIATALRTAVAQGDLLRRDGNWRR
ncbi:hypothetical protein ACFOD4_13320 [Pseudoroseomonas globiformis]|uniref:Glycoside hydrolase family 65 N-terminal domain-containing protein n=1 Tax=Teichococcus globiformis TaxID=2307229 RepID=A0ABV7G745_9PROT